MSTPRPSERQEITKASGIMALFTLISRVLGLVRNQVLSHFFGAGLAADAFIAAFTIPNALRRLFGEGALTPALVSLLSRRVASAGTEGPDSWKIFVTNAFYWLTIVLILVIGLALFFAEPLVNLYVPEFKSIPGKFELTVKLTRYLFPFILFIGWAAFFMGVLNTFRSFALPAFGPSVLNLSVIIIVPLVLIFVWPNTDNGIMVYATAILIGGLLQAFIQLPKVKSLGALPRGKFQWNDPHVKELGLVLIPSLLSMGTYQLNIIVNRIFASSIEGAVSHLYYSDLILELPISIVATSVGTAVIPSFSRLIASQQRTELGATFKFALDSVLFFALPAAAGIFILQIPLVSTIYFTGKFTWLDTQESAACLFYYALGLPFFASLRILIPLFFANKNTKTPARISIVSFLVNLVFAWKLSQKFGAPGIAAATSISSAVNAALLFGFVYRTNRDFPWRSILRSLTRLLLATAIMTGLLFAASQLFSLEIWSEQGIQPSKIISLGILVSLGVVIFGGAAVALKIDQAEAILRHLKARVRRHSPSD